MEVAHTNAEHGATEWSKTTTRACSRLVPSLHQIFNRAESFTGVANDSYGLLLSSDSAFIFPYVTSSTIPPILTFPLPTGEQSLLGALVPGPSNEPGLLVVMPSSGRIGFWPALHSALAPTSGLEAVLSLGGSEYVNNLCNAGAAGLVLSTSTGRMVHISLRDSAGKAIVHLTNMSAGGGWLGAIRNATTRKDVVAIKAGAAHSREERQVHAITRRGGLTIWEVARGGNYRNLLDLDLFPLLATQDTAEVLDVVANPAEANSVLILTRTAKGLIDLVGVCFDSQAVPRISKCYNLPALENPRVQLPNPGHVAFVHTRKGVHIITLADNTIDHIKLNENVDIVAIGTEDQMKNKRNCGLVLLTKGAGVLRIETFANQSVPRTNPLKSKIEQAVFYGGLEGNPICFKPAPADADVYVREVSSEIISGTTPFLPKSVNLKEVLAHRMKALTCLAEYILHNVKPTTVQVLRQNIEKTAAAEALWHSIDPRLESGSIIKQLLPLPSQSATETEKDAVRYFFLHNVGEIARVVSSAHRACIEAAAILDSEPLSSVVLETNDIILSLLLSATIYRDDHPEYGTEGTFWTSSADILQSVSIQFDITQKLIVGLKSGEGEKLRDQLVGLASLNCRLFSDYLSRTTSSEHELSSVSARYSRLRPKWLNSLVHCGRVEKALEIGEQFRDFQSLIEICHDQGEKANDEDVINTVVRRLEWYLHNFGYDFATTLWEYYIARKQYWNLLHEFPDYRKYLTQFFEDGRYPNISWINEIILKNYAKAGESLLRIPESQVEKRKVQLSIAKLAILIDSDDVPANVERQIQTTVLLDDLVKEVRASAADAIDAVAALELACGSLIPSTHRIPQRNTILRRHLSKLLQGEVLHTAEAIDYLTTRSAPDFYSALKLLTLSDLPAALHELLEALIWRRCLIYDNWPSIMNTSGRSDFSVEVETASTQLYLTVQRCLSQLVPLTVDFKAPSEVHYVEHSIKVFPGVSEEEQKALEAEAMKEMEILRRYEDAGLLDWHGAVMRAAQQSLGEEEEDGNRSVMAVRESDENDVFMKE